MKKETKRKFIENIAGFFLAMFFTAASAAIIYGAVAILSQLFSI